MSTNNKCGIQLQMSNQKSIIDSMNRYSAPRIASYIKGLNSGKKNKEATYTKNNDLEEMETTANKGILKKYSSNGTID